MTLARCDTWLPQTYTGQWNSPATSTWPSFDDSLTLDANQEESQLIGRVYLPGGPGTSKTFGNSGSKVEWRSGASIKFNTVGPSSATLRVGIKKASSISTTSGPPGRATAGSAAFDVYKDLTAGTDTINSNAWISTAMATLASGAVTVTHGDLIAICHYLNLTSGTESVKVAALGAGSGTYGDVDFPFTTLVTSSGGTFQTTRCMPTALLIFDDGSVGWLFGATAVFDSQFGNNIGNGNIIGNVFNLPFSCVIDAVGLHPNSFGGTVAADVGIWTTPFGTPAAFAGNVSCDPQILNVGGNRMMNFALTQAYTYVAGTDIVVGIKQNSATNITLPYQQWGNGDGMQADGLDDSACYYASSVGGAAFAGSALLRWQIWAHVSHVDVGGAGGGMLRHPGMSGGLNA